MANRPQPDFGAAEMAALYRQNYLPFQYLTVQFMTEYLIDVSQVFKGDVQSALILAIVGQTQLSNMMASRSENNGITQLYPTNASRLSDVTAIPRETVRRKLEKLRSQGWIDRDQDGNWFLQVSGDTAAAQVDLSDLENRCIDRYAAFVAAFNRLTERYAEPAEQRDRRF